MSRLKVVALLGLALMLILAACTTPAVDTGNTNTTNDNAGNANMANDNGASTPAAPAGTGIAETPAPVQGTPGGTDLLTADQIQQVQSFVTQQLNLQGVDVQIVSVEEQTWTDSCLGLGGAAESCLVGDYPGYRVTVSVNGQQYEVHASSDFTTVRLATP